jgi:hypothetical protein
LVDISLQQQQQLVSPSPNRPLATIPPFRTIYSEAKSKYHDLGKAKTRASLYYVQKKAISEFSLI